MKNKKKKGIYKNEEKGIIRLQYNLFIANNKNLQRKGFL